MARELWTLPIASTALIAGPVFAVLPRRQCELSFQIEGPEGESRTLRLRFDGVQGYKCTYLSSLSAEMIRAAYDRLVDLGATPWLTELSERYERFWKNLRVSSPRLRHLMICFDDGPCYEFVCAGFRSD